MAMPYPLSPVLGQVCALLGDLAAAAKGYERPVPAGDAKLIKFFGVHVIMCCWRHWEKRQARRRNTDRSKSALRSERPQDRSRDRLTRPALRTRPFAPALQAMPGKSRGMRRSRQSRSAGKAPTWHRTRGPEEAHRQIPGLAPAEPARPKASAGVGSKGTTFAELVKAAEGCPAKCIHPGAPRPDDKTATPAVRAKAAKFQ